MIKQYLLPGECVHHLLGPVGAVQGEEEAGHGGVQLPERLLDLPLHSLELVHRHPGRVRQPGQGPHHLHLYQLDVVAAVEVLAQGGDVAPVGLRIPGTRFKLVL